ncbi:hypothetical protein EUA69_03410 [TM7 phylum sp. oral taxon 352]|nr:hypothetical protein EUA69_03410 [TM7 phylum sp. oral taxon 352]
MASSRGPKKSLGQHWLKDPEILADIAEAAELTGDDVVLEIGPGLGTLTSRLLARANSVTAVEFDADLARKLPGQFPGKKLTVVNQDILQFDLNQLTLCECTNSIKSNVQISRKTFFQIVTRVRKTMQHTAKPRKIIEDWPKITPN